MIPICGFIILGITVIICFPRKIRSSILHLSYLMKYTYIGLTYNIDDIRNARYNKIDLFSMPDKIAIVTGGSRGLGAEVVKQFLQCDMEVIIACRTITAGEQLILNIRKSGISGGQAKVYKLDNSSLKSVKEFVEQIKKNYDKIHILINNAGVMFPSLDIKTEEGFEMQWGVNYLSHFLLTSLTLPLLEAGGRPGDCSRIINVSSCADVIGAIDFEMLNGSKELISKHFGYGQSKLAQTMSTITLQKLFTERSLNVQIYTVHPGIVNTDLFDKTYVSTSRLFTLAWKTPEKGATPITYTAVSKNIETRGGIYISNCKEITVTPLALEKKIREQLFELSLKQAGLDDFFQYLK